MATHYDQDLGASATIPGTFNRNSELGVSADQRSMFDFNPLIENKIPHNHPERMSFNTNPVSCNNSRK